MSELILNLKIMQIAVSILILDIIKNHKKIKRRCLRIYKLFTRKKEGNQRDLLYR